MSSIIYDIIEEMDEVSKIADSIYNKLVGDYFSTVITLSERFRSNTLPITDTELEEILTLLPLKLFQVSEALSKAKLTHEGVKLKTKECDKDKELDYKLTAAVYASVIARIEKELTYSRELVMSSKKIWDSRRDAETSPIHTDVSGRPELPDYDNTQHM